MVLHHEYRPSATNTTLPGDFDHKGFSAPAGKTIFLWYTPLSVYEADARLALEAYYVKVVTSHNAPYAKFN